MTEENKIAWFKMPTDEDMAMTEEDWLNLKIEVMKRAMIKEFMEGTGEEPKLKGIFYGKHV